MTHFQTFYPFVILFFLIIDFVSIFFNSFYDDEFCISVKVMIVWAEVLF